eukprot:PRCOL_00002750-RA
MVAVSVADILTRVNAISTKYEHYDDENNPAPRQKGQDPFEHLYVQLLQEVQGLEARAEEIKDESDRAAIASKNAEVRRAKQSIRTEWPKLEKYAMKKKRGTSQEDIDDKVMRAHALEERLEAIPDGSGARRGVGGAAPGGLRAGIGSMGGPGRVQIDTLTADEIEAHPEYAQTSEESRAFRHEWENAKARQDLQIETISKGLTTLKGIAEDMNTEMDRQAPMIENLEDKVDDVGGELKSQNVKLKETLTRLRSSRNFCVDVVLIIILLGIGAYIYSLLK